MEMKSDLVGSDGPKQACHKALDRFMKSGEIWLM
jgi:hypothetical protein